MWSYYLVSSRYGWEYLIGNHPLTLAKWVINNRQWMGKYRIVRNDLLVVCNLSKGA